MIISYLVGQKYYPIKYPIGEMLVYVVVAMVLFAAMSCVNSQLPIWGALAANTLIIFLFLAFIVKRDFPLSQLPVVGKYFR